MSKKVGYNSLNIKNFKKNWKNDVLSGFLVFLLALPLSLGIAKASGFPDAMGILTAMIGGLVTVFFNVSELSIKGPAAGLITIAAGAVTDLGGNEQGWKIASAAIVIMAIFQILFGILKFGSLSDFFPQSAVHGMLAAIGLIIIAKQIPVLLGVEPSLYKGQNPFELYYNIPNFIQSLNIKIFSVGFVSLIIVFLMPTLKTNFFNKIPAAIIVLIISIALSFLLNLKELTPDYALVKIGNFWGNLNLNADFSAINSFVFWKYVIMFLFVSSLESLLTVKAVDNLDPLKRTSNYNGDLIGQGAGNFISGFFGGLPMISEVLRSSSNISFGAKTKWSNFFHGLFLLIAMIFIIPVIELIPNSALAALLIFAGYKLANPKEFIHTYKIGKEQLSIFLTTIIVTLAEDLLLGILAGISVKILFLKYYGASIKNLFKANFSLVTKENKTTLFINDAAIFSNLYKYKKILSEIPENNELEINFENATLIDHSFITFLHRFEIKMKESNRAFKISGLEKLEQLSNHHQSTRISKNTKS
jgi:MFS superfamily sulfate permease-like transporter